MKKILIATLALAFSTIGLAQKTPAEVAKFSVETINLGKIKQHVPATATFTVTNIGTEPLIIEEAKPTCGCTIGDYTKSPIAPGKTGTITATFNAAALNHFDKHLNVKFAGITEFKSITLSGDVLSPEDFEKWKLESAGKVKKTTKPVTVTTKVTKTKAAPANKAAKKTVKTKTVTTTSKG